ncbi:MAG: RDD family protein [Silanimonas sp.]
MSSPTWYCVNAARERLGPMAAEEIRRRFEAGELQRRSLVWQSGMPQWVPLEQMAGELGIALAAAPPSMLEAPTIAATPQAPSATIAPAPTAQPATDAALAQAYAASSRDASATGSLVGNDVVDAGFWKRAAALLIDSLILTVAFYAVFFLLLLMVGAGASGFMTMFEASATGQPPSGPLLVVFIVGGYVVPFVMRWAYFTFFTASSWQGTPGKRAVGIKVVDLDGRAITKSRATGRWFAAALSYLTFYIGFLLAAFTDRKQALHDMVAGTRVVDRWAYTDQPERQQRGLGGCAIAALVGIGLLFIVFTVGIIAAISMPAYQDYTQRAKISEVVNEGRGMTVAIDEFLLATDRCPATLEEAGLVAPSSALVQATNLGEIDAGQCSLRFTLGGSQAGAYDGEYLWLSQDGEGGWDCGGSMEDKLLPLDCRG